MLGGELMACENHAKTEERLDRLEKVVERLEGKTHDNDIWRAEFSIKLDTIENKLDTFEYKMTKQIEDLQKGLKDLSEKPSRRMDLIVNTFVTVLTSSFVAYLLTQLMK